MWGAVISAASFSLLIGFFIGYFIGTRDRDGETQRFREGYYNEMKVRARRTELLEDLVYAIPALKEEFYSSGIGVRDRYLSEALKEFNRTTETSSGVEALKRAARATDVG